MFDKQTGGGSWEEYCYCCGLPFYFGGFDIYRMNEISDDPEVEAALKKEILANAKALKGKVQWLEKSNGFDSEKDLIFSLGIGSDSGNVEMEKKQPSVATQKVYDSGEHLFVTGDGISDTDKSPRGLAIHKDCVAVLEKAIGRKMVPSDEILIRKIQKPNRGKVGNQCTSKYSEQFFAWEKALLDKKFNFASPLADKKQQGRVLKCMSKVIKRVATKRKAVAKGTKRKKRD
jgi:hypothetical protein